MKKKVVYIIGQLSVGGSEKYILNLVTHLDKTQFTSHVICLSEFLELQPNLENIGCKVHVSKKFKYFNKFRSILALIKILKKLQPDIVEIIGWAWYYSIIACSLAKIDNIIVTSRDIPNWKKWHHLLADKILLKKAKVAIFNSNQVRKHTWINLGLPIDRSVVIYSALDISQFEKAQNKAVSEPIPKINVQKANSPILCIVSNLTPIKSVDTIIKAHSLLVKTHPKAQLLIIGQGTMKPQLNDLVVKLNITNNVQFLGRRNDVPAILKNVDVAVSSSISEGASNSILEYMAASLPIVATNVGGTPELITHNKTGLLVPSKSPQELYKAITKLLENEQLMIKLGQQAREKVEEKFSMGKMINDTKQIYLSLE